MVPLGLIVRWQSQTGRATDKASQSPAGPRTACELGSGGVPVANGARSSTPPSEFKSPRGRAVRNMQRRRYPVLSTETQGRGSCPVGGSRGAADPLPAVTARPAGAGRPRGRGGGEKGEGGGPSARAGLTLAAAAAVPGTAPRSRHPGRRGAATPQRRSGPRPHGRP